MNKLLSEELERIKIGDEEKDYLKEISKRAIDSIERKLKKLKLDASVFVGGSLAKDTIIRKKDYDVDIFLRFDKKYSEDEIKKYFRRVFWFFRIKGERIKLKKLKGSRGYVKIYFKKNKSISIEVIPTLRVSKPEQARNVTDMSYFHVNYVKKEINKNKKLSDEILLAKSFCHAQKCYGAESYVNGFSGYALELLIIHYGSFQRFLREMIKAKEKIIIDDGKNYKNKQDVLNNINKAKTESPIILIDPTFKERNVASSLSRNTFERFKKVAKEFLENPSTEFFEYKKPNISKMKEKAYEVGGIFAMFEIKTKKQPGDIAGTKLLKFARFFIGEVKKSFEVVGGDFEYSGLKKAWVYLVLERKKEIIIDGPSIKLERAVYEFKKRHPIWFVEEGKIKCAKRTDITIKEFLNEFKKTNKKRIREMSIRKIKIV